MNDPMHAGLREIPARILDVAIGALTQANQHAVYYNPGMDHWADMSVLNAAMAGELFLKAIVAKEHPLLIFRDLFQLDDPLNHDLKLEHIIEKGKTYNFEHMPKLLWVSTGERLPDVDNFEKLRRARNAIQHFCSPSESVDLRRLSLEFLYKNVDPLIKRHFDLNSIEYHEDTSVGYDYLISCLIRHELFFSIPSDFSITEIDLNEELSRCSVAYREQLVKRFSEKGLDLAKIAGGC
ncbi:hypothetical protein [Mesorhizobium sp. WSM4884]|uniref:hypothetical protein n=1 Tax=Mesorhizobium sp. WSM4884 TaxID=3038542 RepID=UPI002415F69C|nr:hypothetical protein [Mesorhizobium sp. WSM4884]MDG4885449.1 hypothetical protein [Mesorhizobium sp. WSM4884]